MILFINTTWPLSQAQGATPADLMISTDALPSGVERFAYSAGLQATNGVRPYKWSVMPNLVVWGDNENGQTNVPVGFTNVVAISGGYLHSLALKADGTVVAWGYNFNGETNVPVGLSNVMAIAGGVYHNLALKSDGRVVAWGYNGNGETNVPAGLSNVVAIAGGGFHNLALQSSGTVVSWGYNANGETNVPAGLSNVVAIAGGVYHSLALKSDGRIVAWGRDVHGQSTVPPGLSNVVAIAGGEEHSLALKSDGTVVAWGINVNGETNVPPGLSNVVAISGWYYHSLALKSNGTVVGWGRDVSGESTVPVGLSNVVKIAAGGKHSLSLRSKATQLPNGLLCSSDGTVYGIPSLPGTSSVSFVVSDSVGASTTKPVEVVINPIPVINVITAVTDRTSVLIPEGGGTNFLVKLNAQPTGETVVVVSWTAGDADISVSAGTNLTFTTNTWAAYQSVTLSAAEDNEDISNGTASITCGGVGITQAVVTATEADDDYALSVTAVNGSVSKAPDTPYYDNGSSVALSAILNDGYHFTGWSGDATGTNNPVNVTIINTASVTANFALNVITVLTDLASVSVPEGGMTNFQVKLGAQPTGDTVVTVSRTSGDTDIAVAGGSSLTFSTINWNAYQVVTLSAAEDNDDNANGTATITCSGTGITNAVVTAAELDDDYTLSVTALNGAVTKAPDTAYYDNGSSAALTAIQNAGYHFVDWSGDASGTNNPVSVTMDADKSVTANFAMNVITVMTDQASILVPEGSTTNFQVKLNAQPTGDTVVVVAWTSGDTDITPTAGTNLTFATNTWDIYQSVTLAAAEDNGDNSNGMTTITCSGVDITNAVVTATEIDDDYTLAVTAINGAVANTPDSPLYDSGASVSLEATQSAGYHFMGWSGAATGLTNPVSLRITSNTSVTAYFVLNVITVLTDRASISVPEGYSTNFQVKLSAQPTGDTVIAVSRTSGDTDVNVTAGGSLSFTVSNWTNDQTVTVFAGEDNGDNANGTATLTCSGPGMSSATVEVAEIDDDYTLTVTATNGAVARNPDSTLYDNGSGVTLTAIQSTGYHFTGWGGDAGGATNPVSVIMDGNKSIMASFALNVITVLTDRASISVREGYSTNFQIRLSAQPTGVIVVATARTAGDSDITVPIGTSRSFNTVNWNAYKSITLSATEDNGDNQNGSAMVTCSGPGIVSASVEATEADDDYILTVISPYGSVDRSPDSPYYDNGTRVTLTATPSASYYFKEYTNDLAGTNNPASIVMSANKQVSVLYGPLAPEVLPPKSIAKKSFTARWKWVDGGAPEGELTVILAVTGFPQYVAGYVRRPVVNSTECLVTNVFSDKEYWYRMRRVMPDGTPGPWSLQMNARVGAGLPVFKNLLSDVPVSKGISQEFAITNLVSGVGVLRVKSSNTNAVKATVTTNALTLQHLWKGSNTAYVTLTLTHPVTGYRSSYGASLRQAGGSVAIVGQSGLTNAGPVYAQKLILENQTGVTIYGVRVRALGLDQQDWLINKTGLDPVSKAAIVEIPCVLPAGSQTVVRLVYNALYKKQSRTRAVTYGAWAIMTPVNGSLPVTGEMAIAQKGLYDGLWLIGLPANRNRLYTVYHSDNGGDRWSLDTPIVKAMGNYLMWMDCDEGATVERLYRVVDSGM